MAGVEQSESQRIRVSEPAIGPFRVDRDYYTSGQAARLLGIPDRTIRRYLAIGKLRGKQHPITGTWQISRTALTSFIEESGCDVEQSVRKLRIFVVNDEPAMISFLSRAIMRALPEAEMEILDDACDALIQVGSARPDLVILKARMSILYGRDIVLAIRGNQQTAKTRVLALSGSPEDLTELAALGADETLITPFTYQELTAKLEGLLPDGIGISVEQEN